MHNPHRWCNGLCTCLGRVKPKILKLVFGVSTLEHSIKEKEERLVVSESG